MPVGQALVLMPWLSFALGGDGVCFVHDAEGFGFMVGAFVLMHNHHLFPLGFNIRSCEFV